MRDSFRVIFPEEDVSSYDLIELIDSALIFHSTMGIETAKLGIPVLTYVKNSTYPNEDTNFCFNASSTEEYDKKLLSLIGYKMNFTAFTNAVRFFNWYTFVVAVDLSDNLSSKDGFKLEKLDANHNAVLSGLLLDKTDIVSYNTRQIEQEHNSISDEREAMKSSLVQLIDKFFIPIDNIFKLYRFIYQKSLGKRILNKLGVKVKDKVSDTKYKLICVANNEILFKIKFLSLIRRDRVYLWKNGFNCIYVKHGRTYLRYSRLISNYYDLLNNF